MSNNDADGIDMSQFHQVFFDEAAEHLANMESLLLEIDIEAPGDEALNAIFRAAHSIKGGAATFGFQDVTSLTHEMETVFDRVRKHEMPLNRDLVDVFLASGDMLNRLLACRRDGGASVPTGEVDELCARLKHLLDAGRQNLGEHARPPRVLELIFGPFDKKVTSADVDSAIADLADFGAVEEVPLPAGAKKNKTVKERRFHLRTDVSVTDLIDTLGFMFAPEKIKVNELTVAPVKPVSAPLDNLDPVVSESNVVAASLGGVAEHSGAAEFAAQGANDGDAGFGLFVDATTLPANQEIPKEVAPNTKVVELKATAKPASAADGASIRVNVSKVDQLINLVGELVITQAMLAQTASKSDPVLFEALFNGLATLERNTRDLQESAMAIRMLPMSFVFSRFPRVVRDLAQKLGKEIDLHTVGEGTELDKGLIERITDPLTHLVRNSIDHGIESAAERVKNGKVAKGTITLRAYHHGGNIVIEVSDDGAGLNRERILAKARERGMRVPDGISDQDVWQLIFEPGFSTAAVVTDVSGRGVGMDVVKRNIKDLGGRVEIDSKEGIGTRICIRLPLTLAILDGMSVRVAGDIFIIPLTFITESLQPGRDAIKEIAGKGSVIDVRGEYLPVIGLREVLGVRPGAERPDESILVILEAEGGKTALLVDDLVGQHQVVIKSLEANFRKVPGISGATIMGDGRVALILDAAYVAKQAHSRLAQAA